MKVCVFTCFWCHYTLELFISNSSKVQKSLVYLLSTNLELVLNINFFSFLLFKQIKFILKLTVAFCFQGLPPPPPLQLNFTYFVHLFCSVFQVNLLFLGICLFVLHFCSISIRDSDQEITLPFCQKLTPAIC